MKKILCTIIVFALLLMAVPVAGALSYLPPVECGDVDMDEDVNIKDATLIQKHIVGLEELTKLQLGVADTDGDGEVNVKDATLIQKVLVELGDIAGKDIFGYIFLDTFVASYDSGKAVAGVPVTFFAEASTLNSDKDFTYTLFVSGMDGGFNGGEEFCYTFAEAGTYVLELVVRDKFGNTASHTLNYEVTEALSTPDELEITAFYNNVNLDMFAATRHSVYFAAHAANGSGDYEYRFLIDGEVMQEFSENNRYYADDKAAFANVITVQVRDKAQPKVVVSRDLDIDSVYM